jgi:hypothetical protein
MKLASLILFSIFFMQVCCSPNPQELAGLRKAVRDSKKFNNKLIGPENYVLFRCHQAATQTSDLREQLEILDIAFTAIIQIAEKPSSWIGEDGESAREYLNSLFSEINSGVLCDRLSQSDERTHRVRQILKNMRPFRSLDSCMERLLDQTEHAEFPAIEPPSPVSVLNDPG